MPHAGILSRSLWTDENVKILVFAFDQGQELSAHTSPFPALVYFIEGEVLLRMGEQEHRARAGSLAYMPPLIEHSLRAETPAKILLVLLKGAQPKRAG